MTANELFKNEFLKRKNKNSSYSLRAFARDIGTSHALVSQIFSGKRNLTPKQAQRAASLLKLSLSETRRWISSSLSMKDEQGLIQNATYVDLERESEVVTSRWFYSAVLESTFLKEFRSEPLWIAKKLGISSAEAQDAIVRLLRVGLLIRDNKKLKKAEAMILLHSKKSSPAIRSYYSSILDKVQIELKDSRIEASQWRYIGGGTIAVNRERVAEAKKRLKEFQDYFILEFACENADEVFQLNINFMSLTKSGVK